MMTNFLYADKVVYYYSND